MVKVSGEKPGTLPANPPATPKPVDPSTVPSEPQAPDTQPADAPVPQDDPAPDPAQAVDVNGTPLKVGDLVKFYGTVSGFRLASDNRLNVWLAPLWNYIFTNDPNNPLQNVQDNKAMLLSGYSVFIQTAQATAEEVDAVRMADLSADSIKRIQDAVQQAKDNPDQVPLPSNFLAPSII